MEYVLKTKDLKKTYGNYNALNGLLMNVPKGSIYGLIGRNGVGKTTLIRLICGLQKADVYKRQIIQYAIHLLLLIRDFSSVLIVKRKFPKKF